MENKNNLGVRKGAWAEEEDSLLRNCIDKFGVGKWHKVPLRAGLNRCRKSCRLRWLNYLRPNLKRGYFSKEEVDLVLRLHKLLGNRWSLIAGRIPGRTANDVENFWNTHILKKSKSTAEKNLETKTEKHVVIKPRPRTLSKSNENSNKNPSSSSSFWLPDDWKNTSQIDEEFSLINDINVPFSLSGEDLDECIRRWLEGDEETPVVSLNGGDDVLNQKIAEFTSLVANVPGPH